MSSILHHKPFFLWSMALLELVRREHCIFRVPVRKQAKRDKSKEELWWKKEERLAYEIA